MVGGLTVGPNDVGVVGSGSNGQATVVGGAESTMSNVPGAGAFENRSERLR